MPFGGMGRRASVDARAARRTSRSSPSGAGSGSSAGGGVPVLMRLSGPRRGRRRRRRRRRPPRRGPRGPSRRGREGRGWAAPERSPRASSGRRRTARPSPGVPGGDPALRRVLVDGYDAAVERVRAGGRRGQRALERTDGLRRRPPNRHRRDGSRQARGANRAGGRVAFGTAARAWSAMATVRSAGCAWPEERARGGRRPAGDRRLPGRPRPAWRSGSAPSAARDAPPLNPNSVGDGLRMGRDAGAAEAAGPRRFYGHLLPARSGASSPRTTCP